MGQRLGSVRTGDLGRRVLVREDTRDRQVWSDTFVGRYHVPTLKRSPTTVLDLGCNIGLTAAHYCALWPQATVVGVEMDSACADLARQNAPQATILEHAVAGKRGYATYDSDAPSDAFALGKGETVVIVRTLAETIKDAFPEPHVDFLKMDIEGAEWGVFMDPAWVPMVDSILVELHAEGASAQIVRRGIDALSNLGFTAVHHEPHPQAVWAWKRDAQ